MTGQVSRWMCIDGYPGQNISMRRCPQCAAAVAATLRAPSRLACSHALQADLHNVERLGAPSLQGGGEP